jgi:hypothetical protein
VKGRSNHYWPRFEKRGEKFAHLPTSATGEKKAPLGCKIRGARCEEDRPLSPLGTSSINQQRAEVPKTAVLAGRAEGIQVKGGEFRARPGDGQVERSVSEQLGDEGDDVLSLLHGIDGGAPYYRLIADAREGPLSAQQLAAARAVYKAHGLHPPRRRAHGGR